MKRSTYILLSLLVGLIIAGGNQTRASHGNDAEARLCPVHHVPLKRENVEIIYGLIGDPCYTDRAEAAEKHFPYANSVVYAGCLIPVDPPKFKEVLYCPKCREVEKTWPCLETRETPMVTELPLRRITKLPTVH